MVQQQRTTTSKLTGFYRCSDILYHYHQSLHNTRDAVQLQKILSPDVLIHPNHPLAAEGAKGIQAYIGTFHDGQARLLFSSAQVSYLRYWLHAMRLTSELIPLPYSDCLFVDIPTVSSMVFENHAALSATSKNLGRMNQYLLQNPLLVERRFKFEKVRKLWNAKKGVWCALKIDAWEVDHTAISDVGWSLVHWESGAEVFQRAHLVVKENQQYRKTHMENGNSEMVTRAALKRRFNDLFRELRQHGPVYLILNDVKGDINYLRSELLQVPLEDVTSNLPDTPSAGVYVVDPAELFHALTGGKDTDRNTLARVCIHLHINPGCSARNAGIDAECSLEALRSMASGAQLDEQRSARWPDQTEVYVEFKPWEDNPNHDDLEGVMPVVKSL